MKFIVGNCCNRIISGAGGNFILWLSLLVAFNSIALTSGRGSGRVLDYPLYMQRLIQQQNTPVQSQSSMESANVYDITDDELMDVIRQLANRMVENSENNVEKRGWQNLHASGWGKRNGESPFSSYYLMPVPSYEMGKRGWQNLQSGWGKRFNTYTENVDNNVPGKEVCKDLFSNEFESDLVHALGSRQMQPTTTTPKKREPSWNNLKGLWG